MISEMKKEIEEQKTSFDLRLKTFEKQESTLLKKLNSLKSQIEGKVEIKETEDEKEEREEKEAKEAKENKKNSRK